MKFGHRARLDVHEDFDSALVPFAVREQSHSRARTYTLYPDTSATVRLLTSVTVTGVTVVVVVLVAVADIPGFKSVTDSGFLSTINTKPAAG
jgi:hypothetical protein